MLIFVLAISRWCCSPSLAHLPPVCSVNSWFCILVLQSDSYVPCVVHQLRTSSMRPAALVSACHVVDSCSTVIMDSSHCVVLFARSPSFNRLAADIKAKGYDVACTAVNDAFVLDAWSEKQKSKGKIQMLGMYL